MSLAKHLEIQHRALQDFVDLLEREQRLLAEADVDGQQLLEVADGKRSVLGEIERLETLRTRAQGKLGYPEGRSGAEQAARDAGYLAAWQQLHDTAQRAQTLNQLNGEVVRMRLEQNQRILNFLNEAAGKPLYGPNGQSRRHGLGGVSSSA